MNARIIPRISGGLGNQLFIYAAARRLALVNDSELVIDNISGFRCDHLYRRHYQLDHFNIAGRKANATERLEPFSRMRRYLARRWNQDLPYQHRSYLVQEGVDFDSRLLSFQLKGTTYLEGYWQSECYFKDIEEQIRQDLQIRPPTDIANNAMAKKILGTNSVAVHVRFFDTPEQRPNDKLLNNASREYYQRAVQFIESRLNNAHYFVFSDQPDAAETYIPLSKDRITLVQHNQGDIMAHGDLWLMSQCRNFIIANSTFSWWGAWLASNSDKTVIAPGFEKREGKSCWGFRGLLPDLWLKM